MALTDRVKLFVIDFDGTALGGYEPYERFPDNLSSFLDDISSQGVLWATCTTWHPYSQDQVFEASVLKSRPVRALGRTSLSSGLYINGRLYLDAEWEHEMVFKKVDFDGNYAQEIRKYLRSCPEILSVIEYFDYIFEVEYKTDKKSISRILKSNQAIKKQTYRMFSSEAPSVAIYPSYMSKGVAVKRLQKTLGISAELTLVAADGINDMPMLKKSVASLQVAPANADGQVKKAVRRNGGIVGTIPYSDGVIEAAKKLLNI